MLVILKKIDFRLLKVALIFSFKILLSRGVDSFIKGIKRLVPLALFSCISTWEFLRTLEKCEKLSPKARASLSISLMFLKIPACFQNSTMNSARCLFLH